MQFARNLLVVTALLLPTAAMAQDTTPTALAGQIVTISVMPGVDARLAKMIDDAVSKQPADKQAEARKTLTAGAADVRTELTKIFTDFYAKDFSVAELQQLKAFYDAPLGKKLVKADVDKPAEVNSQIAKQFMKMVMLLNSLPNQ